MSAPSANKRDTYSALALMAAVVLAMLIANSPIGERYHALLLRDLTIGLPPLALRKDVLHWVNDGLMAMFFLLVGLEIKRECLVGDLASPRRALLPAIGALGGMLVPALIYVLCNFAPPGNLAGWPIPTATDIAFAVGVLALVGPRVPPSLRIFLLALAVIDDLGAIVLIAALFTESLSWLALLLAGSCLVVLLVLNRCGVTRLAPYLFTGLLLWISVLKSGVHATLAGVALGLAIPLARERRPGSAARLEHTLHPWVAFVILPVFALANAGVPLQELDMRVLAHPVTLGITLGLLFGKLLGVFAFTWGAIRIGLGELPGEIHWRHLLGVALLTGIGFTMSLFLGTLAFPDDSLHGQVRIGVLLGSTCAALAGAWWLRRPVPPPASRRAD
jgi:NhaA family Na+:H+ antiporter